MYQVNSYYCMSDIIINDILAEYWMNKSPPYYSNVYKYQKK